jgi:hypothetical protein
MKRRQKPKRHKQHGFAHYVIPVAVFVLLFAIAGTYFVFLSHAATENSPLTIKGIASKCLDNYHNKPVNANKIQLYHCNNTNAQKWTVEANGTIQNANGYCLDVAGGTSATAKSYVHLYTCTGSASQQWIVTYTTHTIVNRHTNLCLDDQWAKTADGNPIWLFQCNRSAAQKWSVNKPQLPPAATYHWLMTSDHVGALLSQDPLSADWFFNTPNSFSMGASVSGLSATSVQGYKSYAQFSSDIANHVIPSTTKWVTYDNESWTQTPLDESQHPAHYMQAFAGLAHQHGLKVIETPARDLMDVKGGDCVVQKGEAAETAYIRCGIAAAAQYADIYEIQAQALQPSVSAYKNFVTATVAQVKAKQPSITVMAGLTTDRGDAASQIFANWQATHTQVSGYWMNTTTPTFPVAKTVFDDIRTAKLH